MPAGFGRTSTSEKNTSSSQRDGHAHEQLLALAQAEGELGPDLAGVRPHRRLRRRLDRPPTVHPAARRPDRRPPADALSVRRRNTSSRRWRPARRSPSGRSRSASQAVMRGDAGRDRVHRRRGTRRARPRRPARPPRHPARPRRDRPAPRSGSRRAGPAGSAPAGVPLASTRPWSTMTTRSASFSASSRSWVVSSTVTPCGPQVGDHPPDELAPARVDAGGRLVEEGDLGSADQRQRQRQPLLLATRQVAPRRSATIAEARPARAARRGRPGRRSRRRTAAAPRAAGCRCRPRRPAASRRCGGSARRGRPAGRARAPGPCRELGRR